MAMMMTAKAYLLYSTTVVLQPVPTLVAQRLWHCAASRRLQVRPQWPHLVEGEIEKCLRTYIQVHAKEPQVVRINSESSITACLIIIFRFQHVKSQNLTFQLVMISIDPKGQCTRLAGPITKAVQCHSLKQLSREKDGGYWCASVVISKSLLYDMMHMPTISIKGMEEGEW